MLVLSRKKNESIIVNNNVSIVVVEIRGDVVRLGVEAPKDISVNRREVHERIQRQTATEGPERDTGGPAEGTEDSAGPMD